MFERLLFLDHKLPSLFTGTLIILTSLFILLFAQGCIKAAGIPSKATDSAASAYLYVSGNPNAILAGIDEARYTLGQNMARTWEVTSGGLQYVASSVASSAAKCGNVLASGAATTVHGIGSGLAWTGRGVGSVLMFVGKVTASIVVFIIQIPTNLGSLISDAPVVSAVVEPSASHSQVPIIDPNDPALLAAQQAMPVVTPAQKIADPQAEEAIWPMHGQITTQFGEKGRYYKTSHTGIDISDDNPSGVTPVKSFRRGKVIETTRNSGLGNHVIVDHGNGITSVYAHLSTMLVVVGQDVDTTTTLGLQGSTGVSTGPHLHFEIRVNGQAADPREFIAGQP